MPRNSFKDFRWKNLHTNRWNTDWEIHIRTACRYLYGLVWEWIHLQRFKWIQREHKDLEKKSRWYLHSLEWRRGGIRLFFWRVNYIDPRIQFTIERENNRVLPFLDMSLKRYPNKIETKIYRKETHTQKIFPLEIKPLKKLQTWNS